MIEWAEYNIHLLLNDRCHSILILTNNARIESATRALNSAHLSKINFQNREEFLYISKTLINFDQILHVTTIDLWRSHTKKVKQASPAINLK